MFIFVVFIDRIVDEYGDFVGIDDVYEVGWLIDCFLRKLKFVGIIYVVVVDVMIICFWIEGV